MLFNLQHSGSRFFDRAAIGLFAVAAFFVVAMLTLSPRDSRNGVAVIFAPWTSATETLDRAVASGGRFIRFGGLSFIAVVMPENPGYAHAVRQNGAWLLADPRLIAACLRPVTGPES